MSARDELLAKVKSEYAKNVSTQSDASATAIGDLIRGGVATGVTGTELNEVIKEFRDYQDNLVTSTAESAAQKAVDKYKSSGSKGKAIADIMDAGLTTADRTAALDKLNSEILLDRMATRDADLERAKTNPSSVYDYGLLDDARRNVGLFSPDIDQQVQQAQSILERQPITNQTGDGITSLMTPDNTQTFSQAGRPAPVVPEGNDLAESITGLTAEQVRNAYLDLLGRTPSPQGLEYWTGVDLDPNIDYQDSPTTITTVEGLRQAIMQGPEYQALQAGDTKTKQVQEAYRTMLGRDPTIADYEYWTGLDFDPNISASESPTTLQEINLIQQAISESPEFQERVAQGLEQPFQPGGGIGQPGGGIGMGQMAPFRYTDFPGGIYGPGQAMPNIFQPAGQTQTPGTQMPATPAPGTTAPGPRTLVSPGITTYAYPQPFGNIDIFDRPGTQSPTPFNPDEVFYQGGPGPRPTMTNMPNIPPASPTNTTTQQDMTGTIGDRLGNLSPAQRALLGSIFG